MTRAIISISAFSIALLIAFAAARGNVEAQTPFSTAQTRICSIDHSSIELGPPGSGKPQRVRELWRVGEDCSVTRLQHVETVVAPSSGAASPQQQGILTCASVQNEYVHEDIVGIDLTRADVAAN